MNETVLKVLHIGVANRGTWPLHHCNASTGFRPAALCDVTEAALANARSITGLTKPDCYTDVDRALAEADVDCVIVCTPTRLHVPLAKKAIAVGKPVLIEKGMAPDWASACDLVRTAADAKAIVCVAQNYRYWNAEKQFARAIRDPASACYLGPVHFLSYEQNRVRPSVGTLSYPFASVWDMSCHHFDNLLAWLGPMESMMAHSWKASWSAYEHDNNTTAHIVFANGTNVNYVHTHDAARATLQVQAHGERGAMIRVGDAVTFNARPLEQFGTRPETAPPPEEAHGEADLLRDFHAYITRGIEPGVSARNNLETMAACEMMVRSITEQRTVRRRELDT